MRSLWSRWVAHTNRPVDARPFALVRVLLPLILLVDLAQLAGHDLLTPLWGLPVDGGFGTLPPAWLPGPPTAAMPLLVGSLVVTLSMVALGVASRPATLVAVIAYATLEDVFPLADRGIDRVIRTVLLLLVFTRAHRCWTLGGLLGWRREVRTTPGWTLDAFHLLLAIIYLSAGLAKLHGGDWFVFGPDAQLYRVLTDPMAGWLDPHNPTWKTLAPLFGLAGSVTVLWELSAVALLTRHAHRYALVGVCMHLGIAFAMKLGIFAWAMLALYPVLLAPWLGTVFGRIDRLSARWQPEGSPP